MKRALSLLLLFSLTVVEPAQAKPSWWTRQNAVCAVAVAGLLTVLGITIDQSSRNAREQSALRERAEQERTGILDFDQVSLAEFKTFFETHRHSVADLDAFLIRLSQDPKWGKWFEYPLPQYASEARQRELVSPDHPRLILFRGRLLLSFITDPTNPTEYNTLEVTEFNPEDGSYQYFELYVAPQNAAASFLRKNGSCQNCHLGVPIWGGYPLWPGSMDGNEDLFRASISPFEDRMFNQWRNGSLNTPRMRLVNQQYFLADRKPSTSVVSGPRMLTELLTKMQMKRAEIFVTNHPDYEKYKVALAAAEFSGEKVELFLKPETVAEITQRRGASWDQVLLRVKQSQLNELKRRKNRYRELNRLPADYDGSEQGERTFERANTDFVMTLTEVNLLFLFGDDEVKGITLDSIATSRAPGERTFTWGTSGQGFAHQFRFRDILRAPLLEYGFDLKAALKNRPKAEEIRERIPLR